jgi:uncharacterized repeat protein (TIGR02543 family)
MPSHDVTLYAHWSITQYTITFNATGGSVNPGTIQVGYGSTISQLPTPTRDSNYTFTGWFDTNGATGGTGFTNTTQVTGNKTLYARWNVKSYTVTWNANGGTADPSTTTQAYASSVTMAKATKIGYRFDGWFSETSGGTKYTSLTMPENGITLYAQWILIIPEMHIIHTAGTANKNTDIVNVTIDYGEVTGVVGTAYVSGGHSGTAPTKWNGNKTTNIQVYWDQSKMWGGAIITPCGGYSNPATGGPALTPYDGKSRIKWTVDGAIFDVELGYEWHTATAAFDRVAKIIDGKVTKVNY